MIRGVGCLGMGTGSVGDACTGAAAGEEEAKGAFGTK